MEKIKQAFKRISVFAAVILAAAGLMILSSCAQSEKQIEETLAKIAAEANKNLPIMTDPQTRLDEIITLPGRKIQYNNTMVDVLAQDIDMDFFKESVGRTLASNVKNHPPLESFRKKNVTFVYRYQDKTGAEIAVFEYTPQDYK